MTSTLVMIAIFCLIVAIAQATGNGGLRAVPRKPAKFDVKPAPANDNGADIAGGRPNQSNERRA